MRSFRRLTAQARAAWKWLTSTLKSEWTIEDYPIETWFHSASEISQASRRKPRPWTAAVINWCGMSGAGNTRLEALDDLRKHFEQFKAANENLPRPGSKVPIKFAATTRIHRHAKLADDFITRVLGVEWAWISDQSSVHDFHLEESNDTLVQKIRSMYGVDVSDIATGNIADILDRIAERASPAPD